MRELYLEWYTFFKKSFAGLPEGKKVEIGSGGGFLKEMIPEVITSDVLPLATNDMTFSALAMPFASGELSAIVMIDTFHHLPDCEQFLKEAERVLTIGGKIIMIEPANSCWGRFIYKNFHHEPFNPKGDWTFPFSGPLSGANGALPWIVFNRDRDRFENEFHSLKLIKIWNHTPIRYLFSGGFTMKQLMPDFMYSPIKWIEKILSPMHAFSMFTTIVIEKRNE